MLDPDMPASELRLHMGELTAAEVRIIRAAIRWANNRADEWRPIETAPKDGTQVMLFWQYVYPGDKHRTCGYEIGYWDDSSWATLSEDTPDGIISHWHALLAPPESKDTE